MKFVHIQLVNLLWVVLVIGFFLFIRRNVKRKKFQKFADPELIPQISEGFKKRNETLRIFLLIAALAFFVLALMRPQYGFEWQEVKREGLDIIIALDTSNSMLAEDVKPNRLERSKLAVKDLLKKLRGDRIGLIAFAGEAFMVCPLTVDYHGFALTLDSVNTKTISAGGTAIASAMKVALKSYEEVPSKYKALIVISDGEDHEGNVEEIAKEVAKKGIKVFTIGIGTSEGDLIRKKNSFGEYEFIKDKNGNFIKSRMEEGSLQKIAAITGGTYIRSSGAEFGLDLIYDKQLSSLEKRSLDETMQKRYYERFQIPLAIAILLCLVEMLLPSRKKGAV